MLLTLNSITPVIRSPTIVTVSPDWKPDNAGFNLVFSLKYPLFPKMMQVSSSSESCIIIQLCYLGFSMFSNVIENLNFSFKGFAPHTMPPYFPIVLIMLPSNLKGLVSSPFLTQIGTDWSFDCCLPIDLILWSLL